MNNLLNYLHGHKDHRSLFGLTMDDVTISQTRGDYLFLDYILAKNRQISKVVELGTFRGLTTFYCGICMGFRGGEVETIDLPNVGQLDNDIYYLWPNNIHQHEFNVLKQVAEIAALINNRTLLICDNGDKFIEADLYAPYIQKGSIMLIHDCNMEWDSTSMRALMRRHGLTELNEGKAEFMGSLYLAFGKN